MTNTSKNTPGNYDYKTEKAAFIIPQATYNKMVYDILGVKKINRSDILSLLQESVSDKIFKLCAEYGFTEKDFLERSRVGIRKEKNNEKKLLLRNGKNNLSNIKSKSNEEIIQLMKETLDKQIDLYSKELIVFWPDGDKNYAITMENIIKKDKIKREHAKAVEESEQKNKEKGKIILNTLSKSDFQLLDKILFEALKNSNKLSKGNEGNTILKFLQINFPKIPKLHSKKAQVYFAGKYFPMFDEKYHDTLEELYPHDRKIVIIPLSKSGKHVCKVRGEIEIIEIVAKKIDEWKIDILSYVDNHINQQHVEMGIQQMIDIYYETLHNISIYTYNDNDHGRLLPIDLEMIGGKYKEKTNNVITLLSNEEFSEKLSQNAISEIKGKISRNHRTGKTMEIDISKIPKFDGFKGILEIYKDYFSNFLEEKNPDKRIEKPGILKILTDYGFTKINIDKTPEKNKITIVKTNKKTS